MTETLPLLEVRSDRFNEVNGSVAMSLCLL